MRFEIVQGEELLSSHSGLPCETMFPYGLALVGEILNMIGLSKRLDKVDLKDHPCPRSVTEM